MTRTEKKRKLANAIREYRGINTITKNKDGTEEVKWLSAPRKKVKDRIVKWLNEFKFNVEETMKKIDDFKTFDEFNAWLRSF
jgi:hypothetical protein